MLDKGYIKIYGPRPPWPCMFLHRINTSGVCKEQTCIKKSWYLFHKVENVEIWYCINRGVTRLEGWMPLFLRKLGQNFKKSWFLVLSYLLIPKTGSERMKMPFKFLCFSAAALNRKVLWTILSLNLLPFLLDNMVQDKTIWFGKKYFSQFVDNVKCEVD